MEKGHTKQSLFSFLITGKDLQLIKKSGCVNYISYSNEREPLVTSLASSYYLDLQYMEKLYGKQIFHLTRLLLTSNSKNFAAFSFS